MPVLRRFGATTVRMYADDHHPPHFHIVGPDFEVMVRLRDFVVIEGHAKPASLAAPLAWARANAASLTDTWHRLNARE